MRQGLFAIVAIGAIAASGCASLQDEPGAALNAPQSRVVVENNKWQDVNVYVVREGRKARLGFVTSLTSREFKLPSWALVGAGEVRLLIDPVGSQNTHLTAPIPLVGGERVQLRVENVMAFSAVMVQSRR